MIHNYVQTINEVVIGPAGSREMGYLGPWQVLNMHAVHYLNFKYVLPDGPISTSNNKPHADPTSGFGHETVQSYFLNFNVLMLQFGTPRKHRCCTRVYLRQLLILGSFCTSAGKDMLICSCLAKV